MRTRINNITFTPGTRSITTGITDLAIDDIRLFINESQMKVICSSMQKDNVVSISSGVVTYKDTFPVLASGDHITFEIDKGDNVAKEATAQEILSDIGDLTEIIEAINGDNVDGMIDSFMDDYAEQLQAILGVENDSDSSSES